MPRGPYRLAFWLTLTLMAPWSGCSQEMAKEPAPTLRLEGRVHIGGAPVGGGWVEFMPIDGTRGSLRSAPLDPAGAFHATSVPAGTLGIRVVSPTPLRTGNTALDARLQALERVYAIHRVLGADSETTPLDIDLLAEARSLQ